MSIRADAISFQVAAAQPDFQRSESTAAEHISAATANPTHSTTVATNGLNRLDSVFLCEPKNPRSGTKCFPHPLPVPDEVKAGRGPFTLARQSHQPLRAESSAGMSARPDEGASASDAPLAMSIRLEKARCTFLESP